MQIDTSVVMLEPRSPKKAISFGERKKAILARLSSEVLRKLRLMTLSDDKDDRDIICQELFADLTGELDGTAQRRLDAPPGTAFFQLLAHYYEAHTDEASDLLVVCRQCWGNKVAAALFTLLLHRWLLGSSVALPPDERPRHIHVLLRSAQGLLEGDMAAGVHRFFPLMQYIYEGVALSPAALAALPEEGQEMVLTLSAACIPYYIREPSDFPRALRAIGRAAGGRPASSTATSGRERAERSTGGAAVQSPPASPTMRPMSSRPQSPDPLRRVPSTNSLASGASDGAMSVSTLDGVDFALWETCRHLRELRSEPAILRYLACFDYLENTPILAQLGDLVRFKLQGEIFDLSVPGGPRYVPAVVRRRAEATLDRLFPRGRVVRRMTRLWFRVWWSPGDWFSTLWFTVQRLIIFWITFWAGVWAAALGRGRRGLRRRHGAGPHSAPSAQQPHFRLPEAAAPAAVAKKLEAVAAQRRAWPALGLGVRWWGRGSSNQAQARTAHPNGSQKNGFYSHDPEPGPEQLSMNGHNGHEAGSQKTRRSSSGSRLGRLRLRLPWRRPSDAARGGAGSSGEGTPGDADASAGSGWWEGRANGNGSGHAARSWGISRGAPSPLVEDTDGEGGRGPARSRIRGWPWHALPWILPWASRDSNKSAPRGAPPPAAAGDPDAGEEAQGGAASGPARAPSVAHLGLFGGRLWRMARGTGTEGVY